jgi:pyruvate-formate lyase
VARLPLDLAVGIPVLNIRVTKDLLATDLGKKKFIALVRSFFQMGGMHLQVSVLDSRELKAARANPESHADLMVRIGGFSAYFTELDPALQDAVIERTEHTI